MAIDSITCYLDNIKTIEYKLFVSSPYEWKYITNKDNEYLSSFDLHINGMFLRYRPFLNKGTLSIKFNVAKLITGDNISSIFSCNIQPLFESLKEQLGSVIDLNVTPHLRFWKVSRLENNVNIIRDSNTIDSLYKLITNIDRSKSFSMHRIYEDNGTIYFGNGKDLNNSNLIIKFYLKLRQIQQINPNTFMNRYFDNDLIILNPKEDVLRLEIVMEREKILEMFKPQIVYSSDNHSANNIEGTNSKINIGVGTFEQAMSYDFQMLMLNNIIKEFNLDKIIATKANLFKLIKLSTDLSQESKQTAKNVINYLNQKDMYHKKKLASSTIYKYKNWILNQGYHFLYADEDLEPISINEIIKLLPNHQQNSIKLFRNSNIYKDLLY